MKIILVVVVLSLLVFAACQSAPVPEEEPVPVVVEEEVEQEVPVDQGPGIFDEPEAVEVEQNTTLEPEVEEEIDILEITKPKGIDDIRVNMIRAKGSLFGGDYILNNLEIGMDGLIDIDLEKLTFTIDQYQYNVQKSYDAEINCNARDAIVNKQSYAVRQDEGMSIVCVGTPTQIQQTAILTLVIEYADREVFNQDLVMPPAIIKQDYIIYGPDKEY